MKYQLYAVSLAICLASQSAHAALVITEVAPNPGAPAGTLLNLDWWELTNTGPSSASLNGYEWVDNPINSDSAVFPNGISVASGESIIIHRDNGDPGVANAFRADWGLPLSVQVLTESQFTGSNTFSGLGSSGDAVYLFDGPPPPGIGGSLISSAPFGPSNSGVSFEWGTNGTGLGYQSILGQNGSYSASNGRIGSPGFATTINNTAVFKDTFELSSFSTPPFEANINAELPGTRQTLATSGYTQAGGTAIEQNPFGPGSGDWLALTTTESVSGAVVDLTTDFGPAVAGKKYSVSYKDRIDSPVNSTADFWQGFGIGDTPDILSPNGTDADFGILLRADGNWSVFLDGTFVGGGSIDTGIRSGEFFDVLFEFDETGASPTVTATIDATLGPVVLGTLPIDALGPGTGFENAGRFFELRAFLDGAAAGAGEVFNHRIDNFTIDNVVPEPATGVMFSLACLICGVRRRAKR